MKLKLRPESEHQYNSPWNIAADFDVEMSFTAGQIAGMLEEYEADYHTGMDIRATAEEIYVYTSGYPVLVSSICKHIDEKIFGKAGFEKTENAWGKVQIANCIFETRLYNYFLSEAELTSAIGNMAKRDKSRFLHDGRLDMDTVLKKYMEDGKHGTAIHGQHPWMAGLYPIKILIP